MAKIKVERGNVVLRVEDYEAQHYLNLGYNVVAENGKVLKRSIPNSIGELQTAYIKQSKEIERLERVIVQLTAALEDAKIEKPAKRVKKTKAEG